MQGIKTTHEWLGRIRDVESLPQGDSYEGLMITLHGIMHCIVLSVDEMDNA